MKTEVLEKRIELLNFKDIFDSAKPYKTLLKAIFIGGRCFLARGKRFADNSNRKCVTQKSLERSSIFLLPEEDRSPNLQNGGYPPGLGHFYGQIRAFNNP